LLPKGRPFRREGGKNIAKEKKRKELRGGRKERGSPGIQVTTHLPERGKDRVRPKGNKPRERGGAMPHALKKEGMTRAQKGPKKGKKRVPQSERRTEFSRFVGGDAWPGGGGKKIWRQHYRRNVRKGRGGDAGPHTKKKKTNPPLNLWGGKIRVMAKKNPEKKTGLGRIREKKGKAQPPKGKGKGPAPMGKKKGKKVRLARKAIDYLHVCGGNEKSRARKEGKKKLYRKKERGLMGKTRGKSRQLKEKTNPRGRRGGR